MTYIEGHDPNGEDPAITAAYADRNRYAHALIYLLRKMHGDRMIVEIQDDHASPLGWPVISATLTDKPGNPQIRLHVRPKTLPSWADLDLVDTRGGTPRYPYDPSRKPGPLTDLI